MPSSKDRLRYLLQEIRKDATPFGGTITPTPQGTGGHAYNPNAGKTNYVVGNPSVRAMQLAMQDLANSVIADATSGTMFRKRQDATPTTGTTDQVSGKKGFNDFLAEQYIGTLGEDEKGVEWSTDPNVQSRPDKQKSQTDIYELDAVMNTFRRIGSPGPGEKEFKADGVWQFRTDNALKNMAGFASALLSLEGDFGLKNDIFTFKDLEDFRAQLSGYTISPEGKVSLKEDEKTPRANKIAGYLKKIARMYEDFRRQITARPSFRPLLENRKAFDKYGPTGSNADVLTEADKALLSPKNMVTGIKFRGFQGGDPSKIITITSMPITALQSTENFEQFLRSVGYNDKEGPTNLARWTKPIVDLIQKQISSASEAVAYTPDRI